MTSLVRGEIAGIYRALAEQLSPREGAIREIVFSGNTTMIYLLLGLDPGSLGAYPYRAGVLDFDPVIDPAVLPGRNERTVLRAIPAASAFLGSDLVGGLAFVDHIGHARNVFFIDIGTNGEMFLRDGSGGYSRHRAPWALPSRG